jgi:hypothetical protein
MAARLVLNFIGVVSRGFPRLVTFDGAVFLGREHRVRL